MVLAYIKRSSGVTGCIERWLCNASLTHVVSLCITKACLSGFVSSCLFIFQSKNGKAARTPLARMRQIKKNSFVTNH